jgi:hypothetical protein
MCVYIYIYIYIYTYLCICTYIENDNIILLDKVLDHDHYRRNRFFAQIIVNFFLKNNKDKNKNKNK